MVPASSQSRYMLDMGSELLRKECYWCSNPRLIPTSYLPDVCVGSVNRSSGVLTGSVLNLAIQVIAQISLKKAEKLF